METSRRTDKYEKEERLQVWERLEVQDKVQVEGKVKIRRRCGQCDGEGSKEARTISPTCNQNTIFNLFDAY